MSERVAINGFGRMGRLALRAAWGFDPRSDEAIEVPGGGWGAGAFDIVHVNDPNATAELSAHLLAFDSVHGHWPVAVSGRSDTLCIGDRKLGYSMASSPADVNWNATGVDIVVEPTASAKA
jgi:glyceraldehyde 3-phosphate dehydrogenase